jgi:hypothetical protein
LVVILAFFDRKPNVSPMLMGLGAVKGDVVNTCFVDLLEICAILACRGDLQRRIADVSQTL